MATGSGSRFALGIDYGTGSVRALVADVRTGEEIATATWPYAHGVGGVLGDDREAECARQHPADYADGFVHATREAIEAAGRVAGFAPDRIVGIGVDATGSTPLPVDADGVALATHEGFGGDLAAMAWLWKDHSAHAEAAEITESVRRGGFPYLDCCGGAYSSEWYWSKALRCLRVAPSVARRAHAWVELCDYVPALLTGTARPSLMARGACAAGHKAMYHERWGGLPSAEFLEALAPGLSRFRATYVTPARAATHRAGVLVARWAAAAGLPAGVPVAVGAIDAHLGAVGAGVRPGALVTIMGTSTCDCMIAPLAFGGAIDGVCGIVPDSIVPGFLGIEAGQPAVGDLLDWYANSMAREFGASSAERHAALAAQAGSLEPGQSGLLALDWHNGNRSVLADQRLSGLLVGQTLHTTHAETYRALVEATAFGARTIIDRIEASGVPIDSIIACGGLAERHPLLMQVHADVCGRPISISRSPQACALGAAIMGAVVGGAHADVPRAQRAMAGAGPRRHLPDPGRHATYRRLHALYSTLHDSFGDTGASRPLKGVMKELLALRDEARRGPSA